MGTPRKVPSKKLKKGGRAGARALKPKAVPKDAQIKGGRVPTPGGPVPTPYPNVLTSGAHRVAP
jgi:hypothetical protein